ncbi:FAD-dependent oxidoreductase [Tamlana crocina]
MDLSYWEIKSWLTHIDFCIVGSGVVGLNCALHLNGKYPKARILILEKGVMPQGASTKNAGFACFGSLSELLDDLKTQPINDVVSLFNKRVKGLKLMRQTLGDEAIGYKNYGGYELFSDDNLFQECTSKIPEINDLLFPVFKAPVFIPKEHKFHFKQVNETAIYNPLEGQIDTGKMMESLLQKVLSKGIKILNTVTVEAFSEDNKSVKIKTNICELSASKLLICTNGFASQFNIPGVKPARAQVLITKPIKNLNIKGTFHLDLGYYYFRNIDDRILLGGGRNLDFKGEETTTFGQTELIQNQLESLLKTTILPEINFEIDHRWSGIMGMGNNKTPIVKSISNHIFCGVKLGGMGVAIGGLIGKELAELAS